MFVEKSGDVGTTTVVDRVGWCFGAKATLCREPGLFRDSTLCREPAPSISGISPGMFSVEAAGIVKCVLYCGPDSEVTDSASSKKQGRSEDRVSEMI